MRQSRFLFSAGRAAFFAALFLFTAALFFPLCRCAAQTTQPYLFAATNDSSTNTTTGFVTLLRDSTTGALTMPPNTSVSFKDTCSPTIIDPTGNYLFSVCGQGVAMYTLDSTTGIFAETSAWPYIKSNISGQSGYLVAAESTGQYVYS